MANTPISPNCKKEKRLIVTCMAFIGFLLIFDQVAKAVIEKTFYGPNSPNGLRTPIDIIPGFFRLVRVHNPGAAWGIFSGHRWPLLAISIIFFLFVVFSFRKLTEGWPERFYALAFIVSGIFGNSIDRIWREGKVVDFLDFYIGKWHWPAFNVADSAICIGVGLYLISSFMRPGKEKDSEKK